MTFDTALHPRGQVSNDGQFRDRERSMPEAMLSEPDETFDKELAPTYSFPATFLGEAESRIEKANRRLAKSGITERFEYTTEHHVVTKEGVSEARVALTLNRPTISLAGWGLAGVHDFTPDGHVVHHWADREVSEDVLDNHCDHCGHRRARGRVFTVTNTDGETKQVGSNCLEAFLGIKPQCLWALDDELGLDEVEEEGREGPGAKGSAQVYPAEDILVVALAASGDGYDYVSRSRSSMEEPATADKVASDWVELMAVGDNPERRALASEILVWVGKQDDDDDGDYVRNLKAVLAGEDRWVSRQHLAIAASGASAYRHAEMQAERDANRVTGFIAPIGEKIEGVEATIVAVRHIEGDYGTSTLIVMRAADGHAVKWFASGYHEYDEGTRVRAKGRVKDHDNYNGEDQTVLTRAKLEVLDAEQPRT